jgi:translation initiation factor IF-2
MEEASAQASRSVNWTISTTRLTPVKVKELNVILKTDVLGSIEPIRPLWNALGTDEVKVRIIHSATGNITESDVMLASASSGIIIGFNVTATEGARRQAATSGVSIRYYNVIYTSPTISKKALKGMLELLRRGHRRAGHGPGCISAGKGAKAAGVMVNEGKVTRNVSVRVRRGKQIVADATVSSLKRFKDDAKEVVAGYECGVGVKDFDDFQTGDVLEFYSMERVG